MGLNKLIISNNVTQKLSVYQQNCRFLIFEWYPPPPPPLNPQTSPFIGSNLSPKNLHSWDPTYLSNISIHRIQLISQTFPFMGSNSSPKYLHTTFIERSGLPLNFSCRLIFPILINLVSCLLSQSSSLSSQILSFFLWIRLLLGR